MPNILKIQLGKIMCLYSGVTNHLRFLTNVDLHTASLIRHGMRENNVCEHLHKERKNTIVTPIILIKKKKNKK